MARIESCRAAALSGLIHVVRTGIVSIFLALFASHKIVGPTVRLVRLLREVGQGRLLRAVNFRRGDPAAPLAAHFNAVCHAPCPSYAALSREPC